MKIRFAVAFVAIALAAGCASGSSGGSATPQPTVTVTHTVTAPPSPSASPTTGATNLELTPEIRAQLVHAKAVETHLRDSAFTGLYKGSAYYALDNETGIYWAGASVVPSHHSIRAEVYSQDEGGYNIFELEPGSPWQIYDAGLDGPDPREGAQCPIKIPADVLAVWHWAPNTCDPPTH